MQNIGTVFQKQNFGNEIQVQNEPYNKKSLKGEKI